MTSAAAATTPPPRGMRPLALGAVAGTVVAWSCSNIIVKLISTTGLVASFYRSWFAIPVLWALPVALPGIRQRLTRRWLTASLVGGGLFAVHQLFFFTSLKLTSVANVAILGALQPALVLLVAGPLFGERVTVRSAVWSAIAVCGAALVVIGAQGRPGWSPLGDVLAVLNLFAFTAYFLASKQLRVDVGALEYVMGMTTVSGIVMLLVALLTGQALLSPRGWDWALLLFLAVVPGTVGHLLTNWAHPHLPAFLVSVALLAVPVLSSLAAAVVLAEPLRPPQLVGGAVVLLSIGTLVAATPAETSEALAESVAETDAP